jgi:hypothetical protein
MQHNLVIIFLFIAVFSGGAAAAGAAFGRLNLIGLALCALALALLVPALQ